VSELLSVRRHRGPLAALAGAWEELERDEHPGAHFRSYAWIAAWWRHFSADREAHVLLARGADGALVGLLPLYQERSALGGRSLRLMGDGIVGSDYLGPLARRGAEAAVTQAFARALADAHADLLALDDLLDDEPLVHALAAPPLGAEVTARYPCPYARLDRDFAAYLAARPEGAGGQFHRRQRWLASRAGYLLRAVCEPGECARALETLFVLHRARWQASGGSQAIDSPDVEDFHRDALAALCDRRVARLFVLEVEGAPRAALYGFERGDTFTFYQAGHDPAWRPRAVGTVLLVNVLAWAAERGLRRFDFLRGNEGYKRVWATGVRHTVRVRALGPGVLAHVRGSGRQLLHYVRATGRRVLPDGAVAWLRPRLQQLGGTR
jgi:CelD/BcsL family acetyltransferase involved in cellulose biosynthesis